MSKEPKEQARFNARLSRDQKQLFEKAASIGGYRSLTDFVILTIQEKAKEIVREIEQIMSSERDSQIFFNAITNPNIPSETLKNALEDYNVFTSKVKK